MRNPRGKVSAILAGSGLLVLVALAVNSRGDIAFHYHLFRLGRDEAYLDTLHGRAEGTPAWKAVQEFTKDPKGEEAWLLVRVRKDVGDERIDAIKRLGAFPSLRVVETLSSLSSREREEELVFACTTALVDCGSVSIPIISQALRESDENAVFLRFQAMRNAGVKSVPFLRHLLSHPKQIVRWQAAETIGQLGPSASSATPELLKALKDNDNYVREEAATALGNLAVSTDPVVTALCHAATDPDLNVSIDSRESIVKLGSGALQKSLPVFRKLLRSETAASAADAVGDLGPWVCSRLLEELTALIETDNEDTTCIAVYAIGRAGPRAASAVPKVIPLLDHRSEHVRDQAVESLVSVGEPAVLALTQATARDSNRLRENSAVVIGKIGPEAKPAIPALLRLLNGDLYPEVRRQAALALGSIGADPVTCIPPIFEALEDEDDQVRMAAVTSLGQFGDFGVPFVTEALRHESEGVRLIAVTTLGQSGSRAEIAVPQLIQILKSDPNPLIRNLSIVTLGKIGPPASDAVPTLLTMADGADYHTRSWVFEALGKLGSAARTAIPLLTEALDDSNELVRKSAKKALQELRKYDND